LTLFISGTALAQTATLNYSNNAHIPSSAWGLGSNVIVNIANGATVYIDGTISAISESGASRTVTIQTTGTCTLVNNLSDTNLPMFYVRGVKEYWGNNFVCPGHLIIKSGITIKNGSNKTNNLIWVERTANGKGICEIQGTSAKKVYIQGSRTRAAIRNEGLLKCEYCEFTDNQGADGGAIYEVSDGGSNGTECTNCTFKGNSANNGGAVFVSGSGKFTMKSGTVIGVSGSPNHATYGGGVYIDGGTFTIESGSGNIVYNTADNGGGVFVNRGTFTLPSGNEIVNNSATNGGGVAPLP